MIAKQSFLKLSFIIGALIAGPVVILGLGGRFLDKWLDTSFVFLLLGVLISMVVSFLLIKKVVRILEII